MTRPHPDSAPEVPVVCGLCRTRYYVATHLIGTHASCPDCRSLTEVRAPAPKPAPRLFEDLGDEYQLQPLESQGSSERDLAAQAAQSNADDVVPVVCKTCRTRMHARRQHLGKRLRCPDCGTVNLIIAPREVPRLRPEAIATDDVVLDQAPPEVPSEGHKEVADRLMATAADHVARKDAERPRPPRHPLREGNLLFPFYPETIMISVVLAGGFGVVGYLMTMIHEMMENVSIGSIMAPFIAIACVFLLILLLGLVLPQLITIIESTSEGYHRVPDWPRYDLLGRAYAIGFWISALGVSGMVGGLLLRFMPFNLATALLALVPAFLLLPAITLSLLANGSIFVPVSRDVFASYLLATPAWLGFYAQTALGVAVVGLGEWLLLQLNPLASQIFTASAVAILSVFYCRLLGRLAIVVTQVSHAAEMARAEAEAEAGGLEQA